jgi:nicotinamide-nucleotide amidase
MQAIELVTIGTELLLGFTVDTNSAFLGQVLSDAGVRVVRGVSVGDREADIRAAVDEALTRTGAVITTGGLGPTRDDISKRIVADLLGLPLEFRDEVWQAVLDRYARFGRTPVESNRSQAMVPAGALALRNEWGTAPGLWIETARGLVVMLPGVPLEMRMLTEREVLPRLVARANGTVIRSVTLRTCGIPESTLAERVAAIEDSLAPLSLAYLPSVTGVDLRLTCWDADAAVADAALQAGMGRLQEVAAEWTYGAGKTDLAAVVLDRLRRSRRKLAVAESCTGGMLGERITEVAGASDVFLGGVVAYDNGVKEQLLDVPRALITADGAVSEAVARAMADGVARRFGATAAVSVTGIAGPSGGSEAKPVGTVWFGFSIDGKVDAVKAVFGGTRTEIRERAAQGALLGLWRRMSSSSAT